ncbi:MAG: lysine-sensitive aspartokinase 3, partial [Bacteroidota bacterium]
MIVIKFGGTSLEDAHAMNNAIEIITREGHRSPLVVLSAVAGATNTLIKAAQLAHEGRFEEAKSILSELLERHVLILENLIEKRTTIQGVIFDVRRRFEELKNLCYGIAILGELTNRSLDAIASVGEQLSSMILTEAMKERELPVELIDARTFMVTDDQFTSAGPILELIEEKAKAVLLPRIEARKIVATQGFLGATMNGVTTTLGRGGSDYSAAIIGAALDAEEIQIWTDVDGVLTADPAVVPGARKIKVMSFREASELAYFGARVLHPSTILPAMKKKIPVYVLNSRRPTMNGTLIAAEPPKTSSVVKSIAFKKGITVINVLSTRMLMAYGFLESIFSVFSKWKTAVDLVSTSEVCVSLTIDSTTYINEIVNDLKKFSEVSILPNKAIVCVVGDEMRNTPGVAAKIFNAIRDINIVMVSEG